MDPNHPNFQNPICKACRIRQLEKYQGYVDEHGTAYEDFAVPCEGIPPHYVNPKFKSILSEDEYEEMVGLRDPVTWAKRYCILPDGTPWIARQYQAAMLRCTARRKVTRWARRIGKSDGLAIYALHCAFTNKNKRVVVVTPQKSHLLVVFGKIRGFIRMNPKIGNSTVRDVSSPYIEIEFGNGSKISGFTSGTKSGSEAVGVRGQDAHYLVVDEADFLHENDLDAIMAMLTTAPKTEFWGSSTPTGRRAHFYNWCQKSPTYRESYHPIMVSPIWGEIEKEVRADYIGRSDAWTHEVMALFGEQTVGVFQNQYIDNSLGEYKYEQNYPQAGWTYCMGIDWNTEAGTEIYVTGYDGHGFFKGVDALNVPKQQWTQLKGLEAVIEMNAKWKPDYIYADEGAGSTSIELLRKTSYNIAAKDPGDPGARIRDIIRSYNFSSKIEVYDPLTQEPIKKHAKPFLVENAVRRFEEGTIKISAYDAVLRSQLENYIIEHRTTAGVPVYSLTEKRVGDHRLDAFMLSLIPYKLEMSLFSRPNYISQIAITPGFSGGFTNKKTRQEQEEQRLQRMPEQRYSIDDPIRRNALLSNDLPGNVSVETVPTNRPGWDTDEEAKYERKYRQRQLVKRARWRHSKPERSNI